MATKKLAKELGLIRKSRRATHGSLNARTGDRDYLSGGLGVLKSFLYDFTIFEKPGPLTTAVFFGQFFSYLIVIDFESTCWKERKNDAQEIIEFPAVLMNTSNGTIEAEFHTYVQPQEHPTLSDFCTELTGIRQTQVEAGVPLQVCLSLFARWLQTLQQEKNLTFLKDKIPAPSATPCAFVTWSDWDLGVCLEYECKRKQIFKPEMLNRWIDLRATYKVFYNRKPKGLNGALQDLGIVFSGREHSGLDDARNTAHLAWRMITDGCVMKLTKSLDRAPLKTKPVLQNPPKKTTFGNGCKKAEIDRGLAKSVPKHQGSGQKENESFPEVNSSTAACQSLVMPKTLLGGLTSPLVQTQKWVQESLGCFSFARSSVSINSLSDTSTNLLLIPTTVDSINAAQSKRAAESTSSYSEWKECLLFPETKESCSYDAVMLEDKHFDTTLSETSDPAWDDTNSLSLKAGLSPKYASSSKSNQILFKNSNTTLYSVEKPSPLSATRAFKIPTSNSKIRTDTCISHPNALVSRYPKVPSVLETSKNPSELDTTACKVSHTSYTDESHQFRLSSGSSASLFLNKTLPNARTAVKFRKSGTAPLCLCGRRARLLTVANGGPNHGRAFYSCPIGRNATGNKKNCGFFQWQSAHLKAVSASTSLCSDRPASLSLSERTFSSGGSNPFKKFFGTSLRH